jgi:hypothetical protein
MWLRKRKLEARAIGTMGLEKPQLNTEALFVQKTIAPPHGF